VPTSTPTRSRARSARRTWEDALKNSVIAVKDVNGLTLLDKDEHMRRPRPCRPWRSSSVVRADGADMAGFDEVAIQRYPKVERSITFHTPGNSSASSTAPRPC